MAKFKGAKFAHIIRFFFFSKFILFFLINKIISRISLNSFFKYFPSFNLFIFYPNHRFMWSFRIGGGIQQKMQICRMKKTTSRYFNLSKKSSIQMLIQLSMRLFVRMERNFVFKSKIIAATTSKSWQSIFNKNV